MARRLQRRQNQARWKLPILQPRYRDFAFGQCRFSLGTKAHVGSREHEGQLRCGTKRGSPRASPRLGTLVVLDCFVVIPNPAALAPVKGRLQNGANGGEGSTSHYKLEGGLMSPISRREFLKSSAIQSA